MADVRHSPFQPSTLTLAGQIDGRPDPDALGHAEGLLQDALEQRLYVCESIAESRHHVRGAEDVLAGRWQGKKTVWIAPDEPGGEMIPFPDGYDHLRAIPVRRASP